MHQMVFATRVQIIVKIVPIQNVQNATMDTLFQAQCVLNAA